MYATLLVHACCLFFKARNSKESLKILTCNVFMCTCACRGYDWQKFITAHELIGLFVQNSSIQKYSLLPNCQSTPNFIFQNFLKWLPKLSIHTKQAFMYRLTNHVQLLPVKFLLCFCYVPSSFHARLKNKLVYNSFFLQLEPWKKTMLLCRTPN